MNFELIRPTEEYFTLVLTFFENKEFYFRTKRPETLNEGIIRNIIFRENTFLVSYGDRIEGIIQFEQNDIENEAIDIHVRFKNMELLFENIEKFYDALYEILGKNCFVKGKSFAFDSYGVRLWQTMGFKIEAVLSKHIFKNGAYHDMIIFSKELRKA